MDDLVVLLGVEREEVWRRIESPEMVGTREFVARIREVAEMRPHVVVAYAWVFYMGLFEGGRWAREELGRGWDHSWELPGATITTSSSSPSSNLGLSFWSFPSDNGNDNNDGEDIKHDFETRLSDVASMLSPEHKADIIAETKIIFERCAEMVVELETWEKEEEAVDVGALGGGIEEKPASEVGGRWWWALWYEILCWLVPGLLLQLLLVLVQRGLWVRVWSLLMIGRRGEGKKELMD